MRKRPYFVLAVREGGRWSQEFGSYDREDVEFERDDYLDHGHKAKDLKVIRVDAMYLGDASRHLEALNAGC